MHTVKVEHTRLLVAVAGVDSNWLPTLQVRSARQPRSEVAVGATAWYSAFARHTVRDEQLVSAIDVQLADA